MAPENSMTPRSPQESALPRTALHRFPGGVLGGYYAPDDLQFVVKEARDAHLYDFSGREYIDYVLGSGPMVLGHAHPAVVAAVEAQHIIDELASGEIVEVGVARFLDDELEII